MDNSGDLHIEYFPNANMTEALRTVKLALRIDCFADVPAEEVYEYFVAEPIG